MQGRQLHELQGLLVQVGLGELAQYSFGLGSAALGGGREDGSDSSSFQGFFSIFLLLGFSCILGLGGELVPGDLGACVCSRGEEGKKVEI